MNPEENILTQPHYMLTPQQQSMLTQHHHMLEQQPMFVQPHMLAQQQYEQNQLNFEEQQFNHQFDRLLNMIDRKDTEIQDQKKIIENQSKEIENLKTNNENDENDEKDKTIENQLKEIEHQNKIIKNQLKVIDDLKTNNENDEKDKKIENQLKEIEDLKMNNETLMEKNEILMCLINQMKPAKENKSNESYLDISRRHQEEDTKVYTNNRSSEDNIGIKTCYSVPTSTYVCFNCGEKGHWIEQCPNSKRNIQIRTKICHHWKNNECRFSNKMCNFAHGVEYLHTKKGDDQQQ